MAATTSVTIKFNLSDGTTAEHTFDVQDGASAYEVWSLINGGGTQDDFMEYMKGKKGDPGVGIVKIEVIEDDDGLASDEIAITPSNWEPGDE